MIVRTTTSKAISPDDLLIFLCLKRHRNILTGESKIPISRIYRITKAAPVTILNSLERLKALGHIRYQKRGRNNIYVCLSNIEARSYGFLDNGKLTHAQKIEEAVRQSYIARKKPDNTDTGMMVRYIESLEQTIMELRNSLNTVIDSLNTANRQLSVIGTVRYSPIPRVGEDEHELESQAQ